MKLEDTERVRPAPADASTVLAPARDVRQLGRYVIVDHIATGGMGSLYCALQSTRFAGLERIIALKTVKLSHTNNNTIRLRFLDEAKTSMLLSHKNLCTTFDVDEVDGTILLAMEFIPGRSVRDLFELLRLDRGAATVPELVALTVEALDGLDYAHNLVDPRSGQPLGLVHRDLSPHNLMISYRGE